MYVFFTNSNLGQKLTFTVVKKVAFAANLVELSSGTKCNSVSYRRKDCQLHHQGFDQNLSLSKNTLFSFYQRGQEEEEL